MKSKNVENSGRVNMQKTQAKQMHGVSYKFKYGANSGNSCFGEAVLGKLSEIKMELKLKLKLCGKLSKSKWGWIQKLDSVQHLQVASVKLPK